MSDGAATPMRRWARPLDDELERLVVISPHFDDAVLGCGLLLAVRPGATVITVLGGFPPAYPDHVTEWDAYGGFRDGDDVVAARREEDSAAMRALGCQHVWLPFSDHQYVGTGAYQAEEIAGPLEAAVLAADPTAVFMPFGLANPDHVLTHRAAALVQARHVELPWFCYEDYGYKHIPGMLAWRVSSLFRKGSWPTPAVIPADHGEAKKRAALACYPTQMPALEHDWAIGAILDAPAPEQYWRLDPPPTGWEAITDSDP
jgi:LmbE family N-acetylglucosaminyl deacetylase